MIGLALILSMLCLHVIADFHLQGCLAEMKQKDKWKKYIEQNEFYDGDWKAAMLMHSIEWSTLIMTPMIVWRCLTSGNAGLAFGVFIVNVGLHYLIDHMKCNWKIINLRQDQIYHLLQVGLTFCIMID